MVSATKNIIVKGTYKQRAKNLSHKRNVQSDIYKCAMVVIYISGSSIDDYIELTMWLKSPLSSGTMSRNKTYVSKFSSNLAHFFMTMK